MAQPARIVMPATAKTGEIVEIKTLVQHVMETGFRRDDLGQLVPREIITRLVVTANGVEFFRTDLNPGMAANPFIAFSMRADETTELVFVWSGDKGEVARETRRLQVS